MTAIAEAIQKVATGPHLSKDLTVEEAKAATLEILSGEADEVQVAIFFIALRMKTETNDENLGILQALQQATVEQTATINEIVTLADPFNGFDKHCPVAAFLPAVLAACGLPTVSQGVKEMGPKFGVTHSQVLALAGANVDLSVEAATAQINNPDCGWSFIDQQHASPALFALQNLRTRMIKRPSLAALEKLLTPINAQQKNHLVVGFVHKAYPPVLAWLAQQIGLTSALIVRGIEGGILPTLREVSNNHQAFAETTNPCEIDPKLFGIQQDTRGVLPKQERVTAQETLDVGLNALSGQSGVAFDSLVLGAAMILWHCGHYSSQTAAADFVRQTIMSGKAKAHFDQGLA